MSALRAMANAANDGMWERVLGIETTGKDCEPTTYRVLFRLFRAIDFKPDDVLVDYGCGRGRVMCIAARMRIAGIRGVEINPDSAASAKRNLEALRGRKVDNWSVYSGSAADFDCGGGSVFYFYNPFGGALFTSVIARVRASVAKSGKAARIVYINPKCRAELDTADWLLPAEVVHTDNAGKVAAIMYRSRPTAQWGATRNGNAPVAALV